MSINIKSSNLHSITQKGKSHYISKTYKYQIKYKIKGTSKNIDNKTKRDLSQQNKTNMET